MMGGALTMSGLAQRGLECEKKIIEIIAALSTYAA